MEKLKDERKKAFLLQMLEEKIKKLKEENEFVELALSYSILTDLCLIKASKSEDEAMEWKKKAEGYKQLENDTLLKLDEDTLLKLKENKD